MKTLPKHIVKNEPIDTESEYFRNVISSPVGYVTAMIDKGENWEWHNAQLAYLMKRGHKVANKCRQSGGSTVAAAEEFAEAQIRNQDFAHIFFSITKEEAQNKIGYVKEFMENTPNKYKRKILYETKQSVEFQNTDGTTTKIISHAQKPSRGLHGNYVFDEADFYQNFRLLFDAAMPGTRKAGGSVKIISTPFDPMGLFREILMGTDGSTDINGNPIAKHTNFERIVMNWWAIPFYCSDVDRAIREAPFLTTADRVAKFGSRMLKEAFKDARTLETFQQEYECSFLEKDARFFTMDHIKNSSIRLPEDIFDEDYSLHWDQSVDDELVERDTLDSLFFMERKLIQHNISLQAYINPNDSSDLTKIEDLVQASKNGSIRGTLICGIDVGTTGHATDIAIFEEVQIDGEMCLIERFFVTRNNWPLPEQQEWVKKNILDRLPIRALALDSNGLGMQMGQALQASNPQNVVMLPMTSQNLTKVMYALKDVLEAGRIGLSADRNRLMNIYNVKRELSSLNNVIWRLKKTGYSHSDSAVSVAIAAFLFLEAYRIGSRRSDLYVKHGRDINTYAEIDTLRSSKSKKHIQDSFEKSAQRMTRRGRHDVANLLRKMGQ